MTLEEIKTELENFAEGLRPNQNLEVARVQIAALHALADILLREERVRADDH